MKLLRAGPARSASSAFAQSADDIECSEDEDEHAILSLEEQLAKVLAGKSKKKPAKKKAKSKAKRVVVVVKVKWVKSKKAKVAAPVATDAAVPPVVHHDELDDEATVAAGAGSASSSGDVARVAAGIFLQRD